MDNLDKLLLQACEENKLDTVKFLVENAADVNCMDEANWNPLHHASSQNLDMVKYLVEKGANINCVDEDNWTPLHYASNARNLDIVKYLVENDADVNHISNAGYTPLSLAKDGNYTEVINYLEELLDGKKILSPDNKLTEDKLVEESNYISFGNDDKLSIFDKRQITHIKIEKYNNSNGYMLTIHNETSWKTLTINENEKNNLLEHLNPKHLS